MKTTVFHMIQLGKFGRCIRIIEEISRRYWSYRRWPGTYVARLAGIKNIRTKSLGSNNKQNVVLATIEGLSAS